MWEHVQSLLNQAALDMTDRVAAFLPGLIGLLLIFLVSLILALLARGIVLRALQGLQFDRHAEHWGLGAIADWAALGGPSVVLARIVMWLLILAGMLASLSALDAALPEAFARQVFGYLPDVMAALLILLVGSGLARFLSRSVLISAVNLQLPWARLLSLGIKWLVLVLTWAMALDHLGIGGRILPLAFGIMFGGIVLALSLAVGLGSKDLVRASLDQQTREPGERSDTLPHV